MHPIKRPKPTDTDEDIQKQEEEFLRNLKANKVVPAANFVKATRPPGDGDGEVGHEEEKDAETAKMDVDGEEGDEGSNNQIEFPTEPVMFQIKERDFDASKLKEFTGLKAPPEVIKLEKGASVGSDDGGGSKRKKSLFARSFDARKKSNTATCQAVKQSHEGVTPSSSWSPMNKMEESSVIGDKIHPYLAGMTGEEILQEQQKLLERLDPKLVNFIRKRSQQKPHTPANCGTHDSSAQPPSSTTMDVDVGNSFADKSESEANKDPYLNFQVEEKDLPIDPQSVKNFTGMDKVELSKLAWAGVIKENLSEGIKIDNKNNGNDEEILGGKSARFDFTGLLLPDKIVRETEKGLTTYEKALHHHGEEMERPGYTVDELLTLARSTNLQQRSIAFDTLSNIYARAHTGIYDAILEQSLFQLLDFMEFIHVVRKGLDHNDSSSINSSLGCLAALLYVEHDECCLDATYLWPGAKPFPLLLTKSASEREGTGGDLKDFEYLQLDLLDFLINRTAILTRVEYLLMSKADLFNEKGIVSLLKVLIRVGRHSPDALMQHDRMLKYIVEHHISPNWILLKERQKTLKGIPLIHASKLVRVLIESSVSNAMKLYSGYRILPSIMAYLAYDQWKEQSHVEDVEDLVLESWKIWLDFLSVGVAIDEYLAFFPVIMQFLQFYGVSDKLNSFDLHHSAHLFGLLTQILSFGEGTGIGGKRKSVVKHSHWELVKDTCSLVERYCYKVLKILVAQHLQDMYSVDLALLSLGKGLEFLAHALKYSSEAETLGLASRFLPVLNEFVKSNTYVKLGENLISHSVMLDTLSEKSRYPSNFSTVGGVKWEGELNPVMRSNSPFHFLANFIPFCKVIIGSSSFDVLYNDNIEKYLTKLKRVPALDTDLNSNLSYFIRFELDCLHEILGVLPSEFPLRFPVAYRALSSVPFNCPKLFGELLKRSLESCCSSRDLEPVYQFYLTHFQLGDGEQEEECESKGPSKSETKVRFDDGGHPGDDKMEEPTILFDSQWSKARAGEHWITHPLEDLYKRAVQTPGYVMDNLPILEQEARGSLSFIRNCLEHNGSSIIQTKQDLVTVYCRICRIFMLGSPNIYIDPGTAPILLAILEFLLQNDILNKVSFEKPVFSQLKPSAGAAVTFYEFYNELIKEYFDNSYFNETFLAYLLLPLRTGEDNRIKTCFWTHEYLQFIRLAPQDKPSTLNPHCYLTRSAEKDPKVLSTFTGLIKRKVITQDRNSFLYEVVTTHLRNAVEFMTEELRADFKRLEL